MPGSENLSGIDCIDCIVYVRSPEGEQMFELGARESVTGAGITAPIEVVAVGA